MAVSGPLTDLRRTGWHVAVVLETDIPEFPLIGNFYPNDTNMTLELVLHLTCHIMENLFI
jgi:hypothetical protein